MPFETRPFDLGNTLARASQINALRSRNKLNQLRIDEFGRIQEQSEAISNAFASEEPLNSLMELGPSGLSAAKQVVDLKTQLANLEGKDLENVIQTGRLVNDAINNAIDSANPRQSVGLALKNPVLAKIFPKVDLDSLSDEELVQGLERMELETRLFNDPQEIANIVSKQFREGDEFVTRTVTGGVPNMSEAGVLARSKISQVQKVEQGEPGAFSGTGTQLGKRQDDFRTSVVNTSLAIDKATDLVKLAQNEPNAIGNPGAIFSFGNNFIRTAQAIFAEVLPGKNLQIDFGPDDVDWSAFENSRLRELASNNAQFRAGVFSIAFAAAVAEQGSRPSDKDVEGKIKEIAGDSSDVLSFTPTIANFVRNIDSRVRKTGRVGGLSKDFLDSVLPELDRSIAAFNETIQSGPAKTSKEDRLKALGF